MYINVLNTHKPYEVGSIIAIMLPCENKQREVEYLA